MEPTCTWRGKSMTSQAGGMVVARKCGMTQMGMFSYKKKSVKK